MMTSETQIGGGQQRTASAGQLRRVFSVDVLMGLVLMLLALDYSRDFLSKAQFLPLDLHHTTFSFFMTRWITHFAAPLMMFLGGIYAYLRLMGGMDRRDLAKFLFIRGLILALIDMFVVSYGWSFSFSMPIMLQVLWALGVSMMLLAGLVLLPVWVAPVIGLVLIIGHQWIDCNGAQTGYANASALDIMLHGYGRFKVMGQTVFALYPVIPWAGVMALGFAVGQLFQRDLAERKKWLYILGGITTLAFVILRSLNGYGDPDQWWPRDSMLFTVLDFINTTKFPPSLNYLLMTLGPGMLALGFLEGRSWKVLNVPATLGRVVVFFYVAVVYLIHLMAVLFAFLQGYHIKHLLVPVWLYPKDYGLALGEVYIVWMVLLLLMFVLCRWYYIRKTESQNPILPYL